MRILVALITYFGLMAACSAGTLPPVGFRTLDAHGLSAVIWYPAAAAGPVTLVGDNPAFVGVPVVKDAPVQGTALPLALLSHGFSGLWRNQAWLAERLAEAGYIAVAFNHPGTSWGDMDPAWATDPGRRPHDVSRVLDTLLADGEMAALIDQTRISVIGHSLGGATALELVGGELDPALLENACGTDRSRIVCNVYRSGGMTAATPKVSARDPRISAAILLDMEGIRGFTLESLSALSVPVLALVSGVEDPGLPLGWEGRAQANLLPPATTRYAEIVGATHFSFMSECKPGAIGLLGEDAYVCEGETALRAALHEEIAQTVIRFLNAGTRLAITLQQP
ncbi:alpha/beta hydrolase family protein [Radicibacter daui]|uniref:alpha/beta hydrolase family protein n=1 Tax=Radicibacter daui TaxID=3064829 RepID=UPI004046C359